MSAPVCVECGEAPRGEDPGLSPSARGLVCIYCVYWNVPPGPERETMRARRTAKAEADVDAQLLAQFRAQFKRMKGELEVAHKALAEIERVTGYTFEGSESLVRRMGWISECARAAQRGVFVSGAEAMKPRDAVRSAQASLEEAATALYLAAKALGSADLKDLGSGAGQAEVLKEQVEALSRLIGHYTFR